MKKFLLILLALVSFSIFSNGQTYGGGGRVSFTYYPTNPSAQTITLGGFFDYQDDEIQGVRALLSYSLPFEVPVSIKFTGLVSALPSDELLTGEGKAQIINFAANYKRYLSEGGSYSTGGFYGMIGTEINVINMKIDWDPNEDSETISLIGDASPDWYVNTRFNALAGYELDAGPGKIFAEVGISTFPSLSFLVVSNTTLLPLMGEVGAGIRF